MPVTHHPTSTCRHHPRRDRRDDRRADRLPGRRRGGRSDGYVEVRRAAPRPRRPSIAVYRRRRAVAGGVLAVLSALVIVAGHDVLAGSGGVPASAAESRPAQSSGMVIAQPGDSLWTIAARHHGASSITRYLDTLVDLNGGATIDVGQTIVLP